MSKHNPNLKNDLEQPQKIPLPPFSKGEFSILTNSPEETESFAKSLASILPTPCVIALEGDLGVGKTTFVRGLASALPHSESFTVQSPTYALARTYPTTPVIHHLDLYRLTHASEVESLGLSEYFYDPNAWTIVEWPSPALPFLPTDTILLSFDSQEDGSILIRSR